MLFTWAVRDWKRAVDMKLSKRDDDLLYLVNHGERSALEERVLRGKLVTAGLKIQPGQIPTHPNDAAECKDR